MKLIVGLGNPGERYQNTKHNAGFMAVDFLAKEYSLDFINKSKFKAHIAEGIINDEKVILIKPQTFMNLSGESLSIVAKFYNVEVEDITVLYDDYDIDLGSIRIRKKGSAAGHNGIKSIIQTLGKETFIRIRLGIKPFEENALKIPIEAYVLSKFKDDEKILLESNFKKLPLIISAILNKKVDEVISKYK